MLLSVINFKTVLELLLQKWTSKIINIGLKVGLFLDCGQKWFYQYLLSIAVFSKPAPLSHTEALKLIHFVHLSFE